MLQHDVKRIVIAGYYGYGNLGDELILHVITKNFLKKYPFAKMTILSGKPKETRDQTGCPSVSRWNLFTVLPEVRRADLFVVGGGGLFQDQTSFRSLVYYLGLILLAQYSRRLVFLYSVGVETVGRRLSRSLLGWVFKKEGIKITVRDEQSKKLLEKIGVSNKNIIVTGDPVFCLEGKFDGGQEGKGKALFIPRFPCPKEGEQLYINVINSLKLAKGRQDQVEGLLFQEGHEKKFFGGLAPYLNWHSLPKQVDDLLWHYATMDCVVSARFHGLVLAAISKKPFIGIGDYNKVGRFCEAWGMPYLPWTAHQNDIQLAVNQIYRQKLDQNEQLEVLQKSALNTVEHIA